MYFYSFHAVENDSLCEHYGIVNASDGHDAIRIIYLKYNIEEHNENIIVDLFIKHIPNTCVDFAEINKIISETPKI